MADVTPITTRRWIGAASWLVAALAAGLLVVAATAPIITDVRVAIVMLALPSGVGVLRGCAGSELTNAERVHRGLVAAAWTATVVAGVIVGWVVATIAFLWALFGGM